MRHDYFHLSKGLGYIYEMKIYHLLNFSKVKLWPIEYVKYWEVNFSLGRVSVILQIMF